MSRSDTLSLIERLFLAHRALQSARLPIGAQQLQSLLGECSRKQLNKTVAHLRCVRRERGYPAIRTSVMLRPLDVWMAQEVDRALRDNAARQGMVGQAGYPSIRGQKIAG